MDEPTQILQFLRPEGVLPAVLILFVTWIAAGILTRTFEKLGERFVDRRLLISQSKAILRLFVFLIGVVVAASMLFRFSNEALLALGGTVAVAIGFAFKDLLASVIAGVIILADRPFQVGDRVTFGGYYGEVVQIGLRAVRLVTLDDSLVTIPNSKFLTDPVSSSNAGALDMLVQMDFFIGADQDLELARKLIGEALAASPYAYLKKPWVVLVNQVPLADMLAIRLRAKVYVIDVKYEKALETDVTEQVMAALRAHRIAPPAILHRHVNAA